MIELVSGSYVNIVFLLLLLAVRMGSIIPGDIADAEDKRQIGDMQAKETFEPALGNDNASQADQAISATIDFAVAGNPEEGFWSILKAFAVFVRRGSLGELDDDFVLSWKSTRTSQPVEIRPSTILSEEGPKLVQWNTEVLGAPVDMRDGVILGARRSDQFPKVTLFSISIRMTASTWHLKLERRSDEYTEAFSRILFSSLVDIIQLSNKNYGKDIYELSQITPSEIECIRKWSSVIHGPINRTIFSYFIERAIKQPQRPAVQSWDDQMTYSEVDQLSTRLAHELQRRGICAGAKVPLLFAKSAWTVVAVLAVMKAGAAFVLTDPSQPEERLSTIIEEVDAKVVLTSQIHHQLGRKLAPQIQVLAIGSELRTISEEDCAEHLPVVPASGLMYIIFTSGSTGRPKGVMISHSNYTSGAIPRASIVGYGPGTRVLDFASYAFDVSIDCMLLTLATGGCICVPSDDDRVNDLSGAIRKMKVNMVHTTPSIARVFDADVIPSLDVLGLGGEAVPAREAAKWNEQTIVLVAYGPSECTVGCSFASWDSRKSYTSLGRGCGSTLWIVDPDDHKALAPIGAPGELLVEGPIVGIGYLNDIEKTEAAFVKDPIWLARDFSRSNRRSDRLYKTGDLVKYDPDGSGAVVFVGRKDQQVKIRGQRVELEEVEHHLRHRLPERIALAAEIVNPGGNGDPMLAAFIVENGTNQERIKLELCDFSDSFRALVSDAKNDLAHSVPKYMVPATFLPLTRMPTTVTGKTDRKQLRHIAAQLSRKQLTSWRGENASKPVNRQLSRNEVLVIRMWKEVLRINEDIGPEDNFFDSGGESLKAMRLVAAAREAGYRLTMATIFGYPTVEKMAKQIVAKPGDTLESPPLPFSLLSEIVDVEDMVSDAANMCNIGREDIEDIYPCTPIQEALMALSSKTREAYVAQRVVTMHSSSAADQLLAAFEIVGKSCDILRTRIVHHSTYGLVQVVVKQNLMPHSISDLKAYLHKDRDHPMSLGDALCRIAFVKTNTEQVDCVLTMHHALYDGWSMPLVVDRLNRAFHGLEEPCRPPFRTFIRALKRINAESSQCFWSSLLEGASEKQFPALPYASYQTSPDTLIEKSISMSGKSTTGSTLATIIRGAWALVVAQQTRSRDVIFGETLTGRNFDIAGIEHIEGPLIATVPCRIRLTDISVAEYLASIQEQTIQRMLHEHFGLQNIRLLSKDARKACELRTGFVLHPSNEVDQNFVKGPADGFVPAGDNEAAQEALKFNSYALMIVCTLDKDGFLVMASFDSNCVAKDSVVDLLQVFGGIVRRLYTGKSQAISDLCCLPPSEGTEVSTARQESAEDNASTTSTFVAESNYETILARLWSGILKIDHKEISSSDNFFDLGGDSIGAMKLVSELKRTQLSLTVAQVFSNRELHQMAAQIVEVEHSAPLNEPRTTHSPADASFQVEAVNDLMLPLPIEGSRILCTYQPRSLQRIAIAGTVQRPRYSVRYDMLSLCGRSNEQALRKACRELVAKNEILRTVFLAQSQNYTAVALDHLEPAFEKFEVEDDDVESFSKDFCNLDIRTSVPGGSGFVKFIYIQGATRSCLIFRISHAQYDELCLPDMITQLGQLYAGDIVVNSRPFSAFVSHVEKTMPQARIHWTELLHGSVMSKLPGPCNVVNRKALVSLTKPIDVSLRPSNITLASYPTAAWALCLGRRLKTNDVVFGEVVSGRGTGFAEAEYVAGPCWQYSPIRLRIQGTGQELLAAVQSQHIESAQYEVMGLDEIVSQCTDWQEVTWFDSVVHQAVKPLQDVGGLASKIETYHPEMEPLKEWKVQTYADKDKLELEIVTFSEWRDFGQALLDDLAAALEQLLRRAQEPLS